MILLTLDFFGLTVALPQIGVDLHASTETLAWALNAYLLAFVSQHKSFKRAKLSDLPPEAA